MSICYYSQNFIHTTLELRTRYADCAEGEIRLINGKDKSEGTVELCINHAWGTICSSKKNWGTIDSNVVCRQLGYVDLGNFLSEL